MPPCWGSVSFCQTSSRPRRTWNRPTELWALLWRLGGSFCSCCWKDCSSLFTPSLAKLGVFYTLTHFGMEKHKRLTRWRRGE